jgi:hypothetical protein
MRRLLCCVVLLLAGIAVVGPREAPAQEGKTGTFFYVKGINRFDDYIARFRFDTGGAMTFMDWVPVGDNSGFNDWPGQSLAHSPANADGPSVLVTGGFRGITAFTVAADGRLSRVGGSPFQGNQPMTEITGVTAIHRRSRSFVYGAETAQNRIRGFELLSDGSLVELPASPFACAAAPWALSSADTYLYASSQVLQKPGMISAYRVQLDGTLDEADGSPYSPGTIALTPALVDPSGQWVYAGDRAAPRVFTYARMGAMGGLQSLAFQGVRTGSFVPGRGIVQGHLSLVIALSDPGQRQLLSLRRDAAGRLTPIRTTQLPGTRWITYGALSPSESAMVVVDEFGGWLNSMSVDQTTGVIAPLKYTNLGLTGVSGLLFVQP